MRILQPSYNSSVLSLPQNLGLKHDISMTFLNIREQVHIHDKQKVKLYVFINPSGRTMALGSTQPLTEISTRNL
jgi:hypothetical protein